MRKLTYLPIFEPTETGYSVYFPDLPGCVSLQSKLFFIIKSKNTV